MKQKQTLCLVILMVGATLLFSAPVQQESAKELFEKAIYLEESKGDLEGAIGLFQKIVKDFPEERTTAAQSLYHIGICYEKLGMRESQKAFQNVIDSYPDQSETVKLARAKLAAISRTKSATKAEEQGFNLKQVWTGEGMDATGGISPDGQFLAFTDWATGDLAIRELATEKNRRITDKGPWTKSQGFAIFAKWSRDGQSIVYSWFIPEGEYFEIRVVGLKELKPKVLYESNEAEFVHAFEFHPDGERVLIGFFRETIDIGFMSVRDGSLQIIKSFEKRNDNDAPWGFALSPDGRFIAFEKPFQHQPNTSDIFLLSADGTEERRLIDHPSRDSVLEWSFDGRYLLFLSERTGTTDMYVIRIEEGEAVGTPTLVKSGINVIYPLGCTNQGQFFYGIQNLARDIYAAEIDVEAGRFLAPPEKQPLVYEGQNAFPEYSPDGRSIVYISYRANLAMSKNALCIRSLESGETRDLYPGLEEFDYPQWRPDAKAISMSGMDEKDRSGIFLMDLQSEEVSPLVLAQGSERIFDHVWSIDGSTLFFTKSKARRKQQIMIYALDMGTGQVNMLPGSPEDARIIDASPDGKWLVFMNRDFEKYAKKRLGIMPTAGGEAQELFSSNVAGDVPLSPVWTPDGRYVLFTSRNLFSANEPWDLWRFSLETKQMVKLDIEIANIRHLSLHPDGRRVIFSIDRDDQSDTGVWMIENFLPKEDKKK